MSHVQNFACEATNCITFLKMLKKDGMGGDVVVVVSIVQPSTMTC